MEQGEHPNFRSFNNILCAESQTQMHFEFIQNESFPFRFFGFG